MTALVAVLIVVACIAAVRAGIVYHVEWRDALRARDADGILRGAEPFTLDRTDAPAVLLVHGAGDTPQTMRGLGEFLYARGFAVHAPLLPWHGRFARDFRHVTAEGWRAAVHEAHEQLRAEYTWVGVVGLSLGGALSVLDVAEYGGTPALVLLAPYLGLSRGLRMAVSVSRIAELISPYYAAGDTRSIRDPVAAKEGLAYGVFTPAAARALRRTADTAAAALPRVRTPTLIVQSPEDNRVASSVAEQALRALGSADKRLEWVGGGGHVITVDFGHEQVFALTAAWLESHGAAALLRP